MKVKTNLTPGQLLHVGEKLTELAKSQQGRTFPLENPAEEDLMLRMRTLLNVAYVNFTHEANRILEG